MRILLPLVFLAIFGVAAPAPAKVFKLPPGAPLVSVDVPEDWKPDFITRGVQARTADNDVFLSVEATTDAREMGTIIDESDAMLKTRKVKLDRSSKRDTKFLVNNFPAEELRYIGFDDAGSVTVTFTFVTIRDTAVVITYVATEEGHKNHQAELGKIVDSVKALAPVTPAPAAVAR